MSFRCSGFLLVSRGPLCGCIQQVQWLEVSSAGKAGTAEPLSPCGIFSFYPRVEKKAARSLNPAPFPRHSLGQPNPRPALTLEGKQTPPLDGRAGKVAMQMSISAREMVSAIFESKLTQIAKLCMLSSESCTNAHDAEFFY